jgi:ribosomal protein S18 acetylase RimI-like enzyme
VLPSVTIRRLARSDVPAIVRLLAKADDADRRHFTPFAYTHDAVDAVVGRMDHDAMFGVAIEAESESSPEELIAFYMLRGLDEGYPSPMYGVYVAPAVRRLGIASLTIRHAIAFCKLNQLPALQLKVYPENHAAVGAYSAMGFTPLREQPPQTVMELQFGPPPSASEDPRPTPRRLSA